MGAVKDLMPDTKEVLEDAMNRTSLLALCLVISFSAPAAAESPEAAMFGAASAFAELQAFRPIMPKRVVPAGFPVSGLQQNPGEPALVTPISFTGPTGGAVGRVIKTIDLVPALNRHLKTSLNYTMGGRQVWVSGAFDRDRNAYVSILIEGQAAKFFEVKGLLTNPQLLDIGTAKFKLSLSPDLVNQMDSEIVLTNAANRKDQQRITLTEMLDAVAAAGENVPATGQSYQLFYYDDVSGGTKSFCLVLKDPKGELHIFLVPAELVPAAGKPAVFKMYQNKAIGLFISGGQLQVLE